MSTKDENWFVKHLINILVTILFVIPVVINIISETTTDSYEYRNHYINILEEIEKNKKIETTKTIAITGNNNINKTIKILKSVKSNNIFKIILNIVLYLTITTFINILIIQYRISKDKKLKLDLILNRLNRVDNEGKEKNIAEFFEEIKTNSSQILELNKQSLMLYELEQVLETFNKLDKYRFLTMKNFFSYNIDIKNSSIKFYRYPLFNYSKLAINIIKLSKESYFASLNNKSLPHWFFTNEYDEDPIAIGERRGYLHDTNEIIGQINDSNPEKKIEAKRYLIFSEKQLEDSFSKEEFGLDEFELFMSYHSNIDLLWINADEVIKIVNSEELSKFLKKEDFIFIDNMIILSYRFDKYANITSENDLLKNIFNGQRKNIEKEAKGKEELKKLFEKTKKID